MPPRRLERRLAALQAQRANTAPRALAFQDIGKPGIDADTVQLVGGGERMPLDEWHRRYPGGLLIRVVRGDEHAVET